MILIRRRAGISKDQNLPSNERFDNKPCYTKSAKDSNNRISDKDSVGDNSKLNRGYGKKISNLPEDGERYVDHYLNLLLAFSFLSIHYLYQFAAW